MNAVNVKSFSKSEKVIKSIYSCISFECFKNSLNEKYCLNLLFEIEFYFLSHKDIDCFYIDFAEIFVKT